MAGKKKSKNKEIDEQKLTFKLSTFDEQHRKNLQKHAQKVDKVFQQAITKVAKAAQGKVASVKEGEDFRFSDFPALDKAVDGFIQEMGRSLQLNIEQGDKEAWTLANTKNDFLVDTLIAEYDLSKKTVEAWKHPHLEALQAFMERARQGMNLSNGKSAAAKNTKGVWNISQFKEELEMTLSSGVGQGKSAAELSKDVRQYLKNPHKLFRRVRDKNGNLKLSKAAAGYHPGQGVYRSSYKNALRLTATENNIAYRTSDHTRWNSLPFVLGIQVHLSNNHTLNGKPFYDICDDFNGAKFPVGFKFTGWHPFCRCYATTLLASEEERDDYFNRMAAGENVSGYKFSGKVEEMPSAFKDWVKENSDRIANANSMPYFLKDNPAYLEAAGYNIPKSQHNKFFQGGEYSPAILAFKEYKSVDKEVWEQSYFSNGNNGFVVTEHKRVLESHASKNERAKFEKEMRMCKVCADNGYRIKYLRGENRPKGQTYDITINGLKADLKCVSGGAGNIVKYAKKALVKQGGEAVVFSIPSSKPEFYESLTKARRECRGKIFFYIENEMVLKELKV